jgi:hypothetical protein
VPRVEFLVPGSPNAGFLSQIAALARSAFALPWRRWRPGVRGLLGGPADWDAMRRWLPQLADVDLEILAAERFRADGYMAQAERRLSVAASEADVFVLLDADTFLIGDLEGALDAVVEKGAVAGVLAHHGFPTAAGRSTVRDWRRVAAGLLSQPLRVTHAYSLVLPAAGDETRLCPFYLNAGVVMISARAIEPLYGLYRRLRPEVASRLKEPYYAGQVALALAIQELALPALPLPMRYNFPNAPRAEALYPDELAEVRVIHYLRTSAIERSGLFVSAERYRAFLDQPLKGTNRTLQAAVARVLGPDYPFS